MLTSSELDILNRAVYLTGNAEIAAQLSSVSAKVPFDESVVDFLNDVSRHLMENKSAKIYSDIITFAFWIRRSSVMRLKDRFASKDSALRLGRGIAFHIAPSNVPVNFSYSLAAGLLSGNSNVVRVPTKDFPQVSIIADAFNRALEEHEEMRPYILLVRYGRDKEINDFFSSIADVRIIWGGNNTISELRKSALQPRSSEIAFADRYSLAVIDSDCYYAITNKARTAEDFYNDTFFSDQNACTSPRIVIWLGSRIEEAKKIFWEEEHKLAEKKYNFQAIQGVNKLTSCCLIAAAEPGIRVEEHTDNLIVRVSVPKLSSRLMDYRDNSGYFYEYNCKDIMELKELCNDKRCQTIAFIGDSKMFMPLFAAGVKGIDRIVPMGKTMDFDLIWDGYDLTSYMTRTIALA